MLEAMLKPGAKSTMPAPDPNDPGYQAYLKRSQEERARDFAALCRFKPDNAALASSPRVVFMGDSITEAWQVGDPTLFSNGVVDRGISGQTSPQMLLRFYQDVIALHPQVVHIMAGTNDVAGNTGPTSSTDFLNNVRAMIDLAQAHGIKVMLASILPADHFFWNPGLHPAAQIADLNKKLHALAAKRGVVWVDYYSAVATPAGAFRPDLSNDGVHPNTAGYAVMRSVFDKALSETEQK
jgi:lysophospholipase L1-like esterase